MGRMPAAPLDSRVRGNDEKCEAGTTLTQQPILKSFPILRILVQTRASPCVSLRSTRPTSQSEGGDALFTIIIGGVGIFSYAGR